ncbi:hypothetical protein ABH920_008956 [Catenulispora sp. EB89]|uniref:hypothetical protein n=1 Tax=Catenulispora sp. EB89 TaxID=3156257 RepID=UPI0035196089
MKVAKLSSGTLYPMLARLAVEGWVTALARVATPSEPAALTVGETTICPLQATAPPMVPNSGPVGG